MRPEFQPLLIGSRSARPSATSPRWTLRGMTTSQKATVIDQTLRQLWAEGRLTARTRCVLVDEVQYGSPITTHARLLQSQLTQLGVAADHAVISVMDARVRHHRLERHDRLGEQLGLTHHMVEVPKLFTVDSVPLLDAIVHDDPASPPETDHLRLHRNSDSRRLFEQLCEAWRSSAEPDDGPCSSTGDPWWDGFIATCRAARRS